MMKYVSFKAVSGVILQIFLLIIPFIMPLYTPRTDIGTLLTVISLLFAILIGFFIAASTSNLLRLQTLIADEDASLIALYDYAKLISAAAAKRISAAIDVYMIAALDYDQLEYSAYTRDRLHDIMRAVNSIKPKGAEALQLYQPMHETKNHLYAINQESALTSKKIISFSHWLILLILSVLLGALLLTVRDGGWLTSLIIGLLFVAIYRVLELMYDIDSNEILAKQLSFENAQHVFQSIDKLPYFPGYALERGYAHPPQKPYRIGVYLKTGSLEKKIKLVKPRARHASS